MLGQKGDCNFTITYCNLYTLQTQDNDTPFNKIFNFQRSKNVTLQNLSNYRRKYINNNSVWPPKNVTTIQTNYPAHITDFMNTFQKCTKKFVRNISNLKPSLLVAFTVTENQVFSKLALFFYCNSGTDGGTVKSKESRGQNNQLRKSSNFHYGRWYNIHQKQNKIYFQYPWVAGHSQE